MRNLFLSVIALGTLIGAGAASAAPGLGSAAAVAAVAAHDPAVQAAQYYEPEWREREEWRRRREFEWRRRAEWRRRQEAREFYRAPPPPPLPYYGYGPRY